MKTDTDKYYKILKHVNKIICLHCQKTLNGINTSNIKRHYKDVHSIEIPRKYEIKINGTEKRVEPLAKEHNQEGIYIDIDKNKFLRCCVGLVAAKNLPFGIYDDEEFFKILIAPYEKKFNTNLNSKNIVSLIEYSSLKIQQIITERIKNKMICLEFDIATAINRDGIIVINVHYIENFKICINTIGVIVLELTQRQQTAYLKEEISKCLEIYQISVDQIYSSTSNNCGNILQINKLPQPHNLKDKQIYNEFMEEKCSHIEKTDESIHSILSMALSVGKSIAHTIQLAAYDVLKLLEADINECRDIVKQLQENFPVNDTQVQFPKLDDSRRWYSTYEMLFSLLQSRQVIENWYIKKNVVVDINWNFITSFVVAFNPFVTCTKKMQTEQYVIGDFYRDWLCCEIDLEDLYTITPYASLLHESMQKSKKVFLDDDAFLAALYLDPRFNFENSIVLSEEQKYTAIANLLKTFEILKNLEDSQPDCLKMEVDTPNMSSSSFVLPSTSSESTYSKLEQRMMQSMTSISNANRHLTCKQKITLLSNQKKVPLDTDILNFWKTTGYDNDIKKIASVVLSVPITQTPMEKAFNALFTILNNFESKLDNNTLNTLLLTKLNFIELYVNNVHLDFVKEKIVVEEVNK
ncbi:uncharacterized protein LOC119676468 [Teleopsis dalmanni]|uniref:uncharacterized protein LOC119676468 n=1 Tax=Teleopsis dalmanni TaxID=139649 RepID=UPI0018CDDB53|nr:uncharacterized protein LOC119676468 [Teleopsis dalmanni]